MAEEIWKSIPDYPNYEVSNLGRVKSLARVIECNSGRKFKIQSKVLKFDKNHGYLHVVLYSNGIPKRKRVHRLVYESFKGDLGKMFVDHRNSDRSDNSLDNLRIATNSNNNWNRKALGYSWSKQKKRFHAEIMVKYKKIHLGYFKTEKEARMAYVRGVIKYHEGYHEAKITKEEIKEAMAS